MKSRALRAQRGCNRTLTCSLILALVSAILASCATYESRSDQIRAHKDQALALMTALGEFPGARTVLEPVEFDCWQGVCDAKDGGDEYGAEALFDLGATETAQAIQPRLVAWLGEHGVTHLWSSTVPPCSWGGSLGEQVVTVILTTSLETVRSPAGYPCSDPGQFLYVAVHWTAPPSLTKL